MMNNEWYIKYYKIAHDVLGKELLKTIDDNQITNEWLSREGWLMFPLPDENNLDEAKNRLNPNIYIYPSVDGENEYVHLGITCNTLDSVEKMKNILDNYHSDEKDKLLASMKKLDNSFETKVSSKIKENHFAQSPIYDDTFSIKSCDIANSIDEMFENVKTIRSRGEERKKIKGTSHPIETPVIDLIYCVLKSDEEIFREKIQQIKQIFESCICIKDSAGLKKEKKRLSSKIGALKNEINKKKIMLRSIRYRNTMGMPLPTDVELSIKIENEINDMYKTLEEYNFKLDN